MTSPVLAALIQARDYISDPSKWGKGLRNYDRPADSFCIGEAIAQAAPDWNVREPVFDALFAVIGTRRYVWWQDAAERTHKQVVAAFDAAIAAMGPANPTPPPDHGAFVRKVV